MLPPNLGLPSALEACAARCSVHEQVQRRDHQRIRAVLCLHSPTSMLDYTQSGNVECIKHAGIGQGCECDTPCTLACTSILTMINFSQGSLYVVRPDGKPGAATAAAGRARCRGWRGRWASAAATAWAVGRPAVGDISLHLLFGWHTSLTATDACVRMQACKCSSQPLPLLL